MQQAKMIILLISLDALQGSNSSKQKTKIFFYVKKCVILYFSELSLILTNADFLFC
jgi:hypothetical protein